ncbi:serine/threonine-protein kinase grp [Nilaparvata lugens]|uniref:serine/threonine-protein kinase grp n=1 Tax=Nilaparvata lugens TaxID=108931 RepID=UPI00193DCDAA|nr:serine/threonine-protein kinase grp [Nilaparvata lugens]XP_039285187.1 serine/threonine-protein kinase grp [Nilaparvata lugens]XP_039285188.1 serine/threonine-protein kinase grp [Nilaparvata lugens]XP_039285189.1 serine/threonine-protein kinase grp [Nilaparvata lugens]
MSNDFVEGWAILQTLGEGAYGEVQLIMNRSTEELVAVKVIDFEKHPEAKESVPKEVKIHKLLSNAHIIQCYGQRFDRNLGYIFLEYVPGGELFDRIEPDIGMPEADAQRYFTQLLSGVEYLHQHGIAHRDLKPENLLLDNNNNLKISDFGMATIFRISGRERLLDKQCGTLPYVAPEVILRPYMAEPADIWSCGIILVAMLCGELPWDKPSLKSKDFIAWKDGHYVSKTPWSKLNNVALSLIRRILVPLPSSRYTIAKIKNHRWYCKRLQKSGDLASVEVVQRSKRVRTCGGLLDDYDKDVFCLSQPNPVGLEDGDQVDSMHSDWCQSSNLYSFSQPVQMDDLLVSTQQLSTQTSGSQTSMQKLVRRMTRFFVTVDTEEAIKCLIKKLDDLEFSWKKNGSDMVTISTVDKRKCNLVFKATILKMEGDTLVDFRLSKGCGLEFKRCFLSIKKSLRRLIHSRECRIDDAMMC